jgi:hypothetical protein
MQTALEHDWTALADTADKIDALKGVLDIERQIADWWRELPYPSQRFTAATRYSSSRKSA